MKDWLCKPTSLEEAKEIIERAVANGAELVEKPTATESATSDEYHWDLCDSWGVIEGETHTSDYADCEYGVEVLTIEQVREQFPSHNEKSVKWEDLEPYSVEWLEFAKSIGATHWHECKMKFVKKGDSLSCMMFGNSGWEINTDFACPSTYSEVWKSSIIDYSPLESKTEDEEVVCSISEPTTQDDEGFPHVGVKCLKDDRPVIITYVGKDVICFEYLNTLEEHSVYKTVAEFTIAKSERELWVEDAIEVMEQSLMVNGSPEQKCRLYAEAIYDKMVKQK